MFVRRYLFPPVDSKKNLLNNLQFLDLVSSLFEKPKAPSTRIRMSLKTAVLAFRLHVNGVFGHQKRWFFKTVPPQSGDDCRSSFVWTDKNVGVLHIIQRTL